jgi:hypothetical protein
MVYLLYVLNIFFFSCSFQVYELTFNLKMKHMTKMPFSLNVADPG